MVRCNLAVLLAERKLKISKVAAETGISRTTLTALANNYTQGIQYDTLNTLCGYLETTPDKLVVYHPVDFRVEHVERLGISTSDEYDVDKVMDAEIKISVIENKRSTICYLIAKVSCFYDEACPCFKITVDVAEPDHIEVFEKNNDVFLQALTSLPVSFKQDLSSVIFHKVANIWPEHREPVLLSFWWPV